MKFNERKTTIRDRSKDIFGPLEEGESNKENVKEEEKAEEEPEEKQEKKEDSSSSEEEGEVEDEEPDYMIREIRNIKKEWEDLKSTIHERRFSKDAS